MNYKSHRHDVPVVEVLRACQRFHAGLGETPDKVLADRFPLKVIMARMDQLCDRGFIDYGVSLRTAFLTPRGASWLEEWEASNIILAEVSEASQLPVRLQPKSWI